MVVWIPDCYSDAIWITDHYRVTEYWTFWPLFRWHLIIGQLSGIWIVDAHLSTIIVVPLFECPVFWSPLYHHPQVELLQVRRSTCSSRCWRWDRPDTKNLSRNEEKILLCSNRNSPGKHISLHQYLNMGSILSTKKIIRILTNPLIWSFLFHLLLTNWFLWNNRSKHKFTMGYLFDCSSAGLDNNW